MKMFIGTHRSGGKLTPEFLAQAEKRVREKGQNEFGVRVVNLYYNPESGNGYCLTEAPSAEAVRNTHDQLGQPVDEITEVEALV